MPTAPAKGKGIVTIYDPTDMQVRVDVRQEQAAALFIGQNAQIKIEARAGQPYGGEVIRIDPLANLARDTVRAKVQFDAPDEFLRTNMTVTVDFLKEAEFDPDKDLPLILPRTAISARDRPGSRGRGRTRGKHPGGTRGRGGASRAMKVVEVAVSAAVPMASRTMALSKPLARTSRSIRALLG